jgi:hypothetical protein
LSAVLVSKEQWDNLPPLRGWRDERFLNAYLAWADRPEAAGTSGFSSTGNDPSATIFADTGSHDWVLLRRPYGVFQCDAVNKPDPLGFTLIRPSAGWNRIQLTRTPKADAAEETFHKTLAGLSAKPLPDIQAAILVSSSGPSHVISVYGTGFEGDMVELASEGGPSQLLFSSPTQINAKVPSLGRIRLSVDGSSTPWVPVRRK